MLDQKLIRENPTSVEESLSLRGKVFNISQIQELTLQKKEIDIEISSLQSESKKLSKLIGQEISKSKNNDSPEVNNLKIKGNEYRTKISEFEEKKRTLDKNIHNEICNLPNLPSKDAPIGKDESHNVQVKTWGDPLVSENLKSHWEIGESLNLFDSVKSTKISKSRFITLIGNGARLERALINFMLDMHTSNGYLELMPPALVNSESLTGSGQLPKFSNESFKCSNDDLWLSPTAEVPLTAFHRNEIIDSKQLPIKYVAYSPCFRREAGSYGRDTKGLIRLHQFNKVELYWFCDPSKSIEAHKKITSDAENILKSNQIDDFGELLNESWHYKKRLSNKITTPKIDDLYNQSLKYGAIGGKLLGAGGGGFMLLYVKKNKKKQLLKKIRNIIEIPFSFSNSGCETILKRES